MIERGTRLVLFLSTALVLAPSTAWSSQANPSPTGVDPNERPTVVILTTGGTIASRTDGPMAAGDSLVGAVPELLDHATVRVEEVSRIGSSQMTPAHWLALAARINQLFDEESDVAGVVVTHGTDTMEETAFFLNLTVRHDRPVVMVGSMRSAGEISADGPANLLNAVRVATSPDAIGRGVLVVLNENISAARDVWKTDNRRVDTFRSPELGHLGFADPDTVIFYRSVLHPHTRDAEFDLTGVSSLPAVAIVADYVGFDGRALEELAEQGSAGIVLETFAGGRMSAGARRAVRAVAEAGVPVTVASRVPGGRIIGNPAAPLGASVVRDLPAHKARILLMLALIRTREIDAIQRILDTY